MKTAGLILLFAVLVACDQNTHSRPDPKPEPPKTGISVSGYARVGVSHSF